MKVFKFYIEILCVVKEMNVGKRMNDNSWHTVKVVRICNGIKVVVDGKTVVGGGLYSICQLVHLLGK